MERSRRCQPDGQGEFIRLANDALLELCPAPVIPHRLSRCKKSTDIPGKVSAILTRRERMDNVPARSVRGLLYAVRPSASSQCSSVVEQLFRKPLIYKKTNENSVFYLIIVFESSFYWGNGHR